MTRRPNDAYRPDTRYGRDVDSAINRLKDFADVLMPGEAEEPILSPPVRAAVFEWLAEVRAAEELAAVECKPRRSALLFGPPGCGKTTLAHHFAARLGLPLACVRSESLISSYLGSTGQNIGKLFDAMKASEGHVVVFFDEVDALGGRRMNDQGASVERANSLNVLLRRIETFQGISLAATNRQDFLDPALWRRFGMQISVDLPGHDERFAIIRRYAAPFILGDDETDELVLATAGASPALLRALMEGVKRSIVVGPRVGRKVEDARSVIAAVVAACAPAPEYEPPPLWANPRALDAVSAALTWPLRRSGGAP
jgi:SpoVK/Ycf46/Vps4 family AAA+-type ATPase